MRSMCLIVLALLSSAPAAVLTAQAPPLADTTSAALTRQLEEVRQATARFGDPGEARRAGYRPNRLPLPAMLGERWFLRITARQQARLDLRRPSALYYAEAGGARVLAGVEYEVLLRSADPVPEGFVSAEDRWRVEERFGPRRGLPLNAALREAIARERRGRSGWGSNAYGQVARLRAWIGIPNPDGIFAEQHRALPYLRAGLPAAYADRGDLDAANGTALLMDGACKAEAGAFQSLVGDAKGEQIQLLTEACQSAVTQVRAAYGSGSADAFNAAAARAWREYNQAIYATLTAQQRVRVEVLLGPGGLLNPRMP